MMAAAASVLELDEDVRRALQLQLIRGPWIVVTLNGKFLACQW